MTILETLITLILSLWLVVTFFYSLFNKQLAPYTQRWDLFRWITSYQLFSKKERNFRLFYRDKLITNGTTEWRIIPLTIGWKWYHSIWFPQAWVLNNVESAVDDLVRCMKVKQNNPARISERFIYHVILRYTHRFPRDEDAAERQFKIEEIIGTVDLPVIEEVFISNFHKE